MSLPQSMNLQEVKNQFLEAVGEIETLERLGFASRSGNWIDTLDFEKAQTACWLVGRVGDALICTLSGQRRELWILQQLPLVSSLLRST
ncbi:hypothetical protein FD723_33175 (plasmid) [Nostoc sp. C052]|uniref:hypothetical protein n=1 Tax=Nostoc sp. C052 TaxID=2576902 RepID=UPI0015C3E02B|nr:hypothetical protein [Nostoc sp. C052]QLE45177.1 hypothetical protein FD723_33175 [Nostoc sp. C052]